MTKDDIIAAVRLASDLSLEGGALADDVRLLCRAVESLWAATKHYEGCITWSSTCQNCSALFDSLYAADRRAERAESALATALARRSE